MRPVTVLGVTTGGAVATGSNPTTAVEAAMTAEADEIASAPKERKGRAAARRLDLSKCSNPNSPSAQNATRAENLEATHPMRLGMIAAEVTNEEEVVATVETTNEVEVDAMAETTDEVEADAMVETDATEIDGSAETTDEAETDATEIDGSAVTIDEAETDATEIVGSAETIDEAETDATEIVGSAETIDEAETDATAVVHSKAIDAGLENSAILAAVIAAAHARTDFRKRTRRR